MEKKTVSELLSWLTSADLTLPTTDCVKDPDGCTTTYFKVCGHQIVKYLRHVYGPDDAEDVTQDTFLLFNRELSAGEQIDSPKAWLFTVARRLMINRRRRERLCARMHVEIAEGFRLVPALVPKGSETPEHLLMAQRQDDALLAAAQALPERERQCFHLRRQGLKVRQIAELLGLKPQRVSELIERAVVALREHLRD